jgi:hypothetical protein
VVDVLANDRSPFPNSPLVLKSASAQTGADGTASINGRQVIVTPGRAFVGVLVVRYRVADATGDPGREVDGRIRLTVKGRPAAPRAPRAVQVGSKTVVLTWDPPVNNGAVITSYTVRPSQGPTRDCKATTCTLDGLTNNVDYTFTVLATNVVGDSDPSPASSPVRPDAKPDMPQPPTLIFGDRSLTVHWDNQLYKDRSPIESVTLEISPAPPAGPTQRSAVVGTSVVWSGLENGVPYKVRVQATNRATDPSDWSPYSASQIPAGVPGAPGQPTTKMLAPVGSQAQMSVSWAAAEPNGDAVTSYTLSVRRGESVLRTIADIPGGQLSQAVTVETSETTYTYTVTAQNKAGISDASPASNARRGVVAPGPVTGLVAEPLDNEIQLTFGAAAANGARENEMVYEYSVNGTWNRLAPDRKVDGVSNGSRYTVEVRAVSTVESAEYPGQPMSAPEVVPFGRPYPPGVSASSGEMTVTLTWSPPEANGRAIRSVEIRVDGAELWENVGANGGSRTVGNGYSQTHTIEARTIDVAGQPSDPASASAKSQDPPSGSLSHGTPAPTGSCSDCAYVVLNYSNVPTGTYTLKFLNVSGEWSPQEKVTITNGSGSLETQAPYGHTSGPGPVWVEVVGVLTTATNYLW